MYTTIYTKVWINNDTHGELMFDIGVMQGCPSPIVMYIDEPKTYLDKIDKESPCLINTVVAIFRYVDDIVLLSRSSASLQKLLNKLYEY